MLVRVLGLSVTSVTSVTGELSVTEEMALLLACDTCDTCDTSFGVYLQVATPSLSKRIPVIAPLLVTDPRHSEVDPFGSDVEWPEKFS